MEVLILIIPLITVFILFFKYREETTWWEYCCVIIPSALIVLLLKFICIEINSADTEYLGGYVTSTTYYEPWNEMVRVRHTRTKTVGTGKNQRVVEEVYYTNEVRNHRAKYCYTSTLNKAESEISESLFNRINNTLNTSAVFIDMHRNYHTKDGDAYKRVFDNDINHMYTISESHTYRNKVKAASNSIFKYTDKDIDKSVVKEYPSITNLDQSPVIGYDVNDCSIRQVNALYGAKYQFRMYMLFFNGGIECAEMQKAYWQGGNKNEFVVCLGHVGDSVTWCVPFSWQDSPILESMTTRYFMEHPYINIDNYAKFVSENLSTAWKRKDFNDFEYINVSVTTGEYIMIIIITLLYNIFISYWVITNEYKLNDNNRYKTNYRLRY